MAGDLATAGKACQRLLEIAPRHADAYFVAAVCALEGGYPADALQGFQTATTLEPGSAEYWAQLARCQALLGRHGEAAAAVERAVALPDTDAQTHDTLGNVLTRIGRHTEAARSFEAAARLMPDQPQLQYNLATALLYCGELDRARAGYERLLEIDPDHARAHLALADLLNGAPPPGRVEQLEAALGRVAGRVDAELVIGQALARTLEADGQTARAFAQWEQSKSRKKAAVSYTIDSDRAIFTAFETLFAAPPALEPGAGHASSAPIFVLGMPRSGTTLVERMLASHSAVTSAGELLHLPLSVKEAGASRNRQLIDIESLARALEQDPATIAARYLERARTAIGTAGRFVDKQPLNFLFIGFIRRALPNARIVCLRRGALDTCLANFRQLFAVNFPYYRYSLSLADTAEYFAMYLRLMRHWDTVFPEAVIYQSYESLVADPEGEIRRLLTRLGLEFEPAVLNFEQNAAPVATASAVQVRRPIYQGSVGAWRRYEQELEPLRRRLEALGVDSGV